MARCIVIRPGVDGLHDLCVMLTFFIFRCVDIPVIEAVSGTGLRTFF